MQNVEFPVNFTFKISTLSNDFTATDANGIVLAYVRQKMFKFVEEIEVFSDESRSDRKYMINANKWLDFSASYKFTNAQGQDLGRVARKGWASLWKSHFEVFDADQRHQYTIREENPWVKVFDALLGEIPFLGLITGYFFNPSYILTDNDGMQVIRIKKEKSFWGRKFTLDKLNQIQEEEVPRLLLSCMMMLLLERRRG